jgi:hypothetical protein
MLQGGQMSGGLPPEFLPDWSIVTTAKTIGQVAADANAESGWSASSPPAHLQDRPASELVEELRTSLTNSVVVRTLSPPA